MALSCNAYRMFFAIIKVPFFYLGYLTKNEFAFRVKTEPYREAGFFSVPELYCELQATLF